MISLISHFFMGLSQAQVHFEDVQSTFGIREVNLSGCAVSSRSTTSTTSTTTMCERVNNTEQESAGICRISFSRCGRCACTTRSNRPGRSRASSRTC